MWISLSYYVLYSENFLDVHKAAGGMNNWQSVTWLRLQLLSAQVFFEQGTFVGEHKAMEELWGSWWCVVFVCSWQWH